MVPGRISSFPWFLRSLRARAQSQISRFPGISRYYFDHALGGTLGIHTFLASYRRFSFVAFDYPNAVYPLLSHSTRWIFCFFPPFSHFPLPPIPPYVILVNRINRAGDLCKNRINNFCLYVLFVSFVRLISRFWSEDMNFCRGSHRG